MAVFTLGKSVVAGFNLWIEKMSELSIVIGIQRTGQGHTGRMLEVIRHARNHGEVHLVTSGTEGDLPLPQQPETELPGLSISFGKRGSIDYLKTLKLIQPWTCGKLLASVLRQPLPGGERRIVISDFEPYTAWRARVERLPCAQLSHQAAFLSNHCPRPKWRSPIAEGVMRWFARGHRNFGLHYLAYDRFIRTPIIRREIRNSEITNLGHYTVYMPAYATDFILPLLKQIPHVTWHLFDRRVSHTYEDHNVSVSPIDNDGFVRSLTSSAGLLTMGGVQSSSETLFLGKKLLCTPMRDQYEQACNAAALRRLGVPTVKRFNQRTLNIVREWVDHGKPLDRFIWPDHTADTVSEVVKSLTELQGTRSLAHAL